MDWTSKWEMECCVSAMTFDLPAQGNGRLKVYDIESKCFESDIKITESKRGRSVRLVSRSDAALHWALITYICMFVLLVLLAAGGQTRVGGLLQQEHTHSRCGDCLS